LDGAVCPVAEFACHRRGEGPQFLPGALGFPFGFGPRCGVKGIHLHIWIELDVAWMHSISPLNLTSIVSPVLAGRKPVASPWSPLNWMHLKCSNSRANARK
jgi:hypothetical protein